jgi:hypothetical protein
MRYGEQNLQIYPGENDLEEEMKKITCERVVSRVNFNNQRILS